MARAVAPRERNVLISLRDVVHLLIDRATCFELRKGATAFPVVEVGVVIARQSQECPAFLIEDDVAHGFPSVQLVDAVQSCEVDDREGFLTARCQSEASRRVDGDGIRRTPENTSLAAQGVIFGRGLQVREPGLGQFLADAPADVELSREGLTRDLEGVRSRGDAVEAQGGSLLQSPGESEGFTGDLRAGLESFEIETGRGLTLFLGGSFHALEPGEDRVQGFECEFEHLAGLDLELHRARVMGGPARFERVSSWLEVVESEATVCQCVPSDLPSTELERQVCASSKHEVTCAGFDVLLRRSRGKRLYVLRRSGRGRSSGSSAHSRT